VQYVAPGALHATFYNSASTPIATAQHAPFSATVSGATQVRYRGLLMLPYSGRWSVKISGCNFTLGAARFDGAYVSAASFSGGNTTLYVSVIDRNALHDFVFHCSSFSTNVSSVDFTHTQYNSSAVTLQSMYSGFNLFSQTIIGQGLWATYYDDCSLPSLPTAAIPNQVPSWKLSSSLPTSFCYAIDVFIRWSGFIQVNSTGLFTFAIRYWGQDTATLTMNGQVSSSLSDDVAGTINLVYITIFLRCGVFYDIDISILFKAANTQHMYELLWIEKNLPEASIAAQLSPFPVQNLYSTLSSSKAITNDVMQFPWTSPLDTRIIDGAPMARGMGYNRLNAPLMVVVNSGYMCAATSSF